jgi:hypothetical protein
VLKYHPHEPARRAKALLEKHDRAAVVRKLSEIYAVDLAFAEKLFVTVPSPQTQPFKIA